MIAYLTVLIQFACLIFIFLSGPLITNHFSAQFGQSVGLGLGLWAIWEMRIGNFNITLNAVDNGKVVSSGPYKYIRHPMYTALLIFTLSMLFDYLTVARIIAWLILFIDILVKLNFEEKALLQHHQHYSTYQKQTWRLVPYIF